MNDTNNSTSLTKIRDTIYKDQPSDKRGTNKRYLAIGDSITTGYGLKDGQKGYATLFAESTHADLIANLAIDGQRASELSAALEEDGADYGIYVNAIKSANIITISIGGNDLMSAFYAFVAEIIGDGYTAENVYSVLTNPLNNLPPILNILFKLNSADYSAEMIDSAIFNTAVTACIANVNAVASKIKKINPDVRILIANQYNPYRWITGFPNIVNLFETGVSYYNSLFKQSASADYNIVDIYSVFNASQNTLTNADLSAFSLDFHPNAAGHAVIAAEMAAVYNNERQS
ncbi:MAG: GDSL-type esterase/lipase family protein [Clostridia bacterium]|nr:GDSL-type esterase/lipase family protein [Clostridia bacterium]